MKKEAKNKQSNAKKSNSEADIKSAKIAQETISLLCRYDFLRVKFIIKEAKSAFKNEVNLSKAVIKFARNIDPTENFDDKVKDNSEEFEEEKEKRDKEFEKDSEKRHKEFEDRVRKNREESQEKFNKTKQQMDDEFDRKRKKRNAGCKTEENMLE